MIHANGKDSSVDTPTTSGIINMACSESDEERTAVTPIPKVTA